MDIIEEHSKIAKDIILLKGGKLLGIWRINKYNQRMTVCKVKCSHGHTWETFVDRLKAGYWCKECYSVGSRIDSNKVKDLIESKGGSLLNDEIKSGKRFITVRCRADGNVWKAALSAIKNKGQWCNECYKRSKVKHLDIEDLLKLLSTNGYTLLTYGPFDFWDTISIRCDKHNIEWNTSYGTLIRGDSKCKLCAWNIDSFDEAKTLIESKGFKIVDWMVKGKDNRRLKLRCDKHNYEWLTTYNYIKSSKRICFKCSREARKTSYETIKKIVEEHDGTLLTKGCVGSTTRIMVRCNKDKNEWETSYDMINSGNHWCAKCQWPTQSKLHSIIQDIFPDKKVEYDQRPFDWLRYKNKLQIDIWVSELKLAIEYDGEQHFEEVKFGSKMDAKKALKATQRRDKKKDLLIAQHPNEVSCFIRFKYDEPITREHVIERLKEKGIKI